MIFLLRWKWLLITACARCSCPCNEIQILALTKLVVSGCLGLVRAKIDAPKLRDIFFARNLSDPLEGFEKPLKCLRTARILEFIGSVNEFRLVEFILGNLISLETDSVKLSQIQ